MTREGDVPGTPSAQWRVVRETSTRGPSGHMRILTRRYVLPDGRQSDWDLLDGGRTVAVLALTGTGRIVLVRQFRPGPARVLDEMPGGYVDEGEDIAEAAARELLEESGYAGEIEVVGQTWLSATATTRRHVAVAHNCRPVAEPRPGPDEDEFCQPVLVGLGEYRSLLRAGAMTDVDLGYLALDHLGLL